jgi:hypothetical protein
MIWRKHLPFCVRSQVWGVGVGTGAFEIVMVTVAVSADDPMTLLVSPCIVIVHAPARSAVTVNDDPDGCEPAGVAAHIPAVVAATRTGIDGGVPGGALAALVSVA